jgi:hypothetical protein
MQAQRLAEVDEEIDGAKTEQVKALRKCEAIHHHSANIKTVRPNVRVWKECVSRRE